MAREAKKPTGRKIEHKLDTAVNDSFPASDPPAHSGITGVGRRETTPRQTDRDERPPSHERDDHARPTGLPTSDRHAAETAHAWEDEEKA